MYRIAVVVALLLAPGALAQDAETERVLARLEGARLSLIWRRLPLQDGLRWLGEESPVEIVVESLPEGERPISLALSDASLLDILDLLADFHGFRCRVERGRILVSTGTPCGFLRTRRFSIADLVCRVAPDPFDGTAEPPDAEAILGPFLHDNDPAFWDGSDGRRLRWRADAVVATHTMRALEEMERRLARVRLLCGRTFEVSIAGSSARVEAARVTSLEDGLRVQVFPTPDPAWARLLLLDERPGSAGVRTDLLVRTGTPVELAGGAASLEVRVSSPSAVPPLAFAEEPLARRIEDTTVEVLDFHDQPLSEVVRYLEQQTGLNFAVHPAVFAQVEHDENRISVRLRAIPLSDCLDLIASLCRLAWSIEHGAIVIRPPTPAPDMRLAVDRSYDLRFTIGWLDAIPRPEPSIQGGRFLLSANPRRPASGLDDAVSELVRTYPPTLAAEFDPAGGRSRLLVTAGRSAAFREGERWTPLTIRPIGPDRIEVEIDGGPAVSGGYGSWIELPGGRRLRVTRTGM